MIRIEQHYEDCVLSYRVCWGTLHFPYYLSDPKSWLRTGRNSRSVTTEHYVLWRANSTLTIRRNRAIVSYKQEARART